MRSSSSAYDSNWRRGSRFNSLMIVFSFSIASNRDFAPRLVPKGRWGFLAAGGVRPATNPFRSSLETSVGTLSSGKTSVSRVLTRAPKYRRSAASAGLSLGAPGRPTCPAFDSSIFRNSFLDSDNFSFFGPCASEDGRASSESSCTPPGCLRAFSWPVRLFGAPGALTCRPLPGISCTIARSSGRGKSLLPALSVARRLGVVRKNLVQALFHPGGELMIPGVVVQ